MNLPNVGDRIRLIEMPHDPAPLAVGETGTVTRITLHHPPLRASRSEWKDGRPIRTGLPAPDVEATLDVEWDNGSSRSLLLPADRFAIVTPRSTMKPEHRTHEQFAADLSTLMTAFVGQEVRVDVSGWAGYYDEDPDLPPFEDPVYVIAEDDEDNEYSDATCDLKSAGYIEQLAFVIEQLVHG